MSERDFSTQDVERVLRSGCIYEPPEHCPRHGNWKYRVRAKVEGYFLEIVVAFDSEQDYDVQPLVIPVTGYWTGEGTRDGKRNDRQKRDTRKTNGKIRIQ
jgi:Domain of unknown function (DUF4258)